MTVSFEDSATYKTAAIFILKCKLSKLMICF